MLSDETRAVVLEALRHKHFQIQHEIKQMEDFGGLLEILPGAPRRYVNARAMRDKLDAAIAEVNAASGGVPMPSEVLEAMTTWIDGAALPYGLSDDEVDYFMSQKRIALEWLKQHALVEGSRMGLYPIMPASNNDVTRA